MRKIHFFILLSAFLISCGGSEQTLEEISVDLNGNMIAFLNGNEWTSGTNNSAKVNFEEGNIHIEGFDAQDGIKRSHITLIVDEVTTGTFDSKSAKAFYYDVRTNSTYISENNCNVDITALDIENNFTTGTFSFSAKNSETGEVKEFQSGEFYQVNLNITE